MNEEQYEEALRDEIKTYRNRPGASRKYDGYQEGLYKALTLLAALDNPVREIREGVRDDLVICENCGGDGVLSKENPPKLVKPYSGPFGLCGQQCRGPRDGDHRDCY